MTITRLTNVGVLYQCRAAGGQAEVHVMQHATMVWEGARIVWIGPESAIPSEYRGAPLLDAGGKIVLPGLIDCHTHLAFGGWREDEFTLKILGTSYLEIAQAGGGILSTVNKTRLASEEELAERCLKFLSEMLTLGVTTIEAKSGYGLTLAHELKLLRVYQTLNARQPIQIIPTLLAAHTFPVEYRENHEAYIKLICEEIIPQVAQEKLAYFCDVFVEKGAFSVEQARRILEVAKYHGLGVKVHVDQLSDGAGAAFAAEMGAISADHLEHSSMQGLEQLAQSGGIGVLLPYATLVTRQPARSARALIEISLPIALATDFNPGSSPTYHLPMCMSLGCLIHSLTPAEVLKAVTINAAKAIGMHNQIGSLEVGKQADFVLIDAPSVEHWLYHLRPNACVLTVKAGKKVFEGA